MSDTKTTTPKDEATTWMRNTLVRAALQFSSYAQNHLAKNPPDYEKAKTNADWADTCNHAVKKYDAAQ